MLLGCGDDRILRIEAPTKDQHFGPSGSVEVTVQLPAGSGINVKVASAEIRGLGRFGEVALDAAHGVSASLDAGTSNGRIHNALKNTEGTPDPHIHATTAYGNIAARSL